MRCRFCGSQSLTQDTEHKNFSAGKAVAGAVILGPIGAMGGFVGKDKSGYRCAECGAFMESGMDLSTEMSIDSAVHEAEITGRTDLLAYFQKQYPNVRANVKVTPGASAALPADAARPVASAHHGNSDAAGAALKHRYRNQNWQKNCPVFIEEIIINTEDGQDVLAMTVRNRSTKSLRSVYFTVFVYDDTGDEVNRLQCTYQGISVATGKRLSQKTTFCLNTNLAYRIKAICDKVAFTDDSVWRNDGTPPIILPIQTELTPDNFPRLKYVRLSLATVASCNDSGPLYLPSEGNGYWQCICGQPVEAGQVCPCCGASIDKLNQLLSQKHLKELQQKNVKDLAAKRANATMRLYEQTVNKEKERLYKKAIALQKEETEETLAQAAELFAQLENYQDANDQLTACQKQIEELKAKAEAERLEAERKAEEARIAAEEAAKKRKKAFSIGAPIVCACIAFVIVLTTVIIPSHNYNKAVALMEAEQYEEAIPMFEALGDYKDSAENLTACKTAFLAPRRAAASNVSSAGYWHTVGLKPDGTVVAAGNNKYDQCNMDSWTDIVAVSAGDWHTIGLKSDGTVVATGSNDDGQCNVDSWTDIVAVSAGGWHTVGLKADRTVVAAGCNDDGQCNVDDWTDIVAVSAGYRHTVGLKADGTVVAVGYNDDGQCSVGNWTDIVAVSAGDWHTVGLKADGTVVAAGSNEYGQCNVGDWTDIVAVSAGRWHTVGLKVDGTVVTVGNNESGQCNVYDWHLF